MKYKYNNMIENQFLYQQKLLDKSIDSGLPFSKLLEDVGLSYDNLVYKNSYSKSYPCQLPSTLENIIVPKHDIPVVSFFSGCGGLDLGFEAASFHHIACFEINELFCKTLRRNRPKWKVFGPPTQDGDVSDTDNIIALLSKVLVSPFEGVFIGGPPCQPFSIAANQRFSKSGNNFKRTGFANIKNGNLLFDYIKLILHFEPKVFLIENVPGLYEIDNGKQLSHAINLLTAAGYNVDKPLILDASKYGIAQQRIRLFIIGSRDFTNFTIPEPCDFVVGCGNILCTEKNLHLFPNSETRQHNASSVKRYSLLNYGQRDHLGRVDRLDPSLPSKTVIAGGTSGGGRSHLHPEIPRTLSVRECARLQTFPDDYIFLGPTARQFTQVGNAVPPVLAGKIAASIYKSFYQ